MLERPKHLHRLQDFKLEEVVGDPRHTLGQQLAICAVQVEEAYIGVSYQPADSTTKMASAPGADVIRV